ncbi:MAG: methyltransferase domain-containing protein [Halioglobus sp.]
MYEYDDVFYNYINEGAKASAGQMLPPLLATLGAPVESVLDVGCGAGAWLSVWKTLDADVIGLDGSYVRHDQLLINPDEFIPTDLTSGFALGRKFSLAQSLEVAEHLPASAAAGFVANLCQHADLVLFSAATPGQGGENHINEQPYSYWRDLFQDQGFAMFDPVRQAVVGKNMVKPWYRYNTFLYASEHLAPEILTRLAPYRVSPDQTPPDIAPLAYRLRKQIIRLLPDRASTFMAVIKKNISGLSLKAKANE